MMSPWNPTKLQKGLAAIIAILTLAVVIFTVVFCGAPKSTVIEPTTPAPAETCSGAALGTAKSGPCPVAGQVGATTLSCQDVSGVGTWVQIATTCSPPPNPTPPSPPPVPPAPPSPPAPPTCTQVTFDANIQPIMQANCATCHAPTYQETQVLGPAEMARRVALPPTDADHMPQPVGNAPVPVLDPTDVQTIQTWVNGGAPENCSSAGTTTQFIDLKYQDTVALNDAQSLPDADAATTEYLYAGDLIDEGFNIKTAVQAINKALNGTNNDTNVVAQVVPVDPLGAVYRVDLNAFGIQAADLAAILAADVNLNITDNTTQGKELTAILGHKPWLHLNNWIDITYRNSAVYYQLIGNPANAAAFQANYGVNLAQDLATLTNVNLIGSQLSQIAEQKNRLLLRATTAQQGSCFWQTFDVNQNPHNIQVVVNGVSTTENTKVLTQFPLLAGAGAQTSIGAAQAVFTQDASEIIACAQNGFLQFFLADAAGNRLNAADENVVIDNVTPLGNHAINTANSCVECHNAGFIPLTDQILGIDGHTTTLAASDVKLVQVLYGGQLCPACSDGANGAFFKKDSSIYLQALSLAGVTPGPDPMSAVSYDYLLNYPLLTAASRVFLTPAQFTTCLGQSAASTAALGTVLDPNGQVTASQFFGALQQLIADCNLFQDSVGG